MANSSNQSGPIFISELSSQNIAIGNTVIYSLPKAYDALTGSTSGITVSVNLGAAIDFISYSDGMFNVTPTIASEAGTYSIEVTLTNEEEDLSNSYTMQMTVPSP